jgi:hypothetical protein
MVANRGRRTFAVVAMAAVLGLAPRPAAAITGAEVMLRALQARNQGDDAVSTYRVDLETPGVGTVTRMVSTYRKTCDGSARQLLVLRAPASVAGTAFLSWVHADRPPDMWMFLPELGRPRQVNAATRGESFLGSDFTYEDLGAPAIDERDHAILDEPEIDGEAAYRVESRPRVREPYGRILTWVSKATFLPLRVEYFDRDDRLLKVGRFRDVEAVNGIPTPFTLEMRNVVTGHRTAVRLLEAGFDRPFDCALLSGRGLPRALP